MGSTKQTAKYKVNPSRVSRCF